MEISIYLKSKEFLFSLIYIPIFISLALIRGRYETIFAVISGIFILSLLGFLINLSISLKSDGSRFKFRSFIRFLISNVLMLLLSTIILILSIQNCTGGLCGLAEAETMFLFVPIQILILLVYGISLIVVEIFNKKKEVSQKHI